MFVRREWKATSRDETCAHDLTAGEQQRREGKKEGKERREGKRLYAREPEAGGARPEWRVKTGEARRRGLDGRGHRVHLLVVRRAKLRRAVREEVRVGEVVDL